MAGKWLLRSSLEIEGAGPTIRRVVVSLRLLVGCLLLNTAKLLLEEGMINLFSKDHNF